MYEQQYGWYISTGVMYGDDNASEAHLRDEGFSEEFVALMIHAKDNDAAMINFDADGVPEPGFKIFDENTDEEIVQENDRPAMRG